LVLARSGLAVEEAARTAREPLGESGYLSPWIAAEALAWWGEAARPAREELRAILNGEANRGRVPAARALLRLGTPPTEVCPALVALILNRWEEWGPSRDAIDLLGSIGPGARDALSAVRRHGNPKVRMTAARASSRLAAPPPRLAT